MPIELRLDYLGVSSYRGTARSTGAVTITKRPQLDLGDCRVLVVDDILDTGLTLVEARAVLRELSPADLKFCVLLEKEIPHQEGFRPDYVGFTIPDTFVVGYGLDYAERYRNLPYIATLKPETGRGQA